ncbi:MAG TPA: hypothetical protein VH500_12195, partial [Nitrososphaeraceae archaeon]
SILRKFVYKLNIYDLGNFILKHESHVICRILCVKINEYITNILSSPPSIPIMDVGRSSLSIQGRRIQYSDSKTISKSVEMLLV